MIDLAGSVNIASGLLLALLGAWAWTLKPKRRAIKAFGLFTIVYGLMFVPANLSSAGIAPTLNAVAMGTLALAAAGALAWLAVTFPHPLAPEQRSLLVLPVVVGVVVACITNGILAYDWLLNRSVDPIVRLAVASAFLTHATIAGALVLFPLRYRASPPANPAARRAYALFAAALVSYFGFTAGAGNNNSSIFHALATGGSSGLSSGTNVVTWGCVVALVALLWLRNTHAAPEPATSRNVALFSLAMPLVGLVAAASDLTGGHGVSRFVAIGILAVAILRHQLLGIDVKLRFAISRSTIAAAFVAAFFLASEGAQILFGQGNEWVGLVGAGALVFALAPLQRAAEQLAEKAVPREATTQALSLAETSYRATVVRLFADGVLSPGDERLLAGLAADLGIDARRAYEIRDEVERATPGAPPAEVRG